MQVSSRKFIECNFGISDDVVGSFHAGLGKIAIVRSMNLQKSQLQIVRKNRGENKFAAIIRSVKSMHFDWRKWSQEFKHFSSDSVSH